MASELLTAIQTAQQTQRDLIAATDAPGRYDERQLVRLRGKFQKDMLAISHISQDDPGLKADREKYLEFSKRHRETQDMLSRHQSSWMLREIERDWEGYQKATMELRKAQDEFFDWAKRSI